MDKQKKRRILIAGIVILLALVLIPVISLQSNNRKLQNLLDLGEKYLEDLDYESAIAVFDEAIAIEPKCAEAYLGKAKAQYALELYEDAMDTLREGIEKVDNPEELEAFLQQILDELSAKNNANDELVQETDIIETEAVVEQADMPIVLNYKRISRRVNTDDPDIQLEVLGDDNEKYDWQSSDPQVATVSDTGLVTCQPNGGYAYITVMSKEEPSKSDDCEIWVVGEGEEESESIRIEIGEEDNGQKQYLVAEVHDEDGSEKAKIIRDVYYSGDILIPEQLTYHNKTIPVTNVSNDAFYWSNELTNVFIPASVESLGENEYYYRSPFGFCLKLDEIKVDEKNEFFQVIDGVLFSKDGKELIAYPAAKKESTYTIPSGVERVYEDAFAGCAYLEEILVEDGNQYYESADGALIDKRENELIAYPMGNKSLSYTVPGNVTAMADNAFYGSRLEEIVCKSVEWIDTWRFDSCDNLKRIECGQGTKSIYAYSADIKIIGLDEAVNLENLNIVLSEAQDIDVISSLKELKSLSLSLNETATDLQPLENLPNLTSLEIYGAGGIEDVSWIGKLENLESLDININTLSDISWLTGLDKLRYFHCNMKKSEIKDLQPLLELESLTSVSIYSQEEAMNEDIEEQINKLKEEKPDVTFYIFE